MRERERETERGSEREKEREKEREREKETETERERGRNYKSGILQDTTRNIANHLRDESHIVRYKDHAP